MKPNLEPFLRKLARRVAVRAASQIRSGAPRVEHRAGARGRGQPGGSLPGYILRADFIRSDRVKAVLEWHALGPEARWLKFGSTRQKARPFDTLPTKQETASAIAEMQAYLAAHYRRRLGRAA